MPGIIIVIAWMASFATPMLVLAGGPNPPPDLVQLEREVSLKMAHARDEGFIEDSKRKTLADAETLDTEGEKALLAGRFERAEDDFLKTKVLLHNLGI
jgi:hypothetical protein